MARYRAVSSRFHIVVDGDWTGWLGREDPLPHLKFFCKNALHRKALNSAMAAASAAFALGAWTIPISFARLRRIVTRHERSLAAVAGF